MDDSLKKQIEEAAANADSGLEITELYVSTYKLGAAAGFFIRGLEANGFSRGEALELVACWIEAVVNCR